MSWRIFNENRKQRVVFNDYCFSWADFESGTSQGSFLEAVLFFIYINNLSDNLASNLKLFADDIQFLL